MAFRKNKISEQFLNDLFRNLSQFSIWQPMAEIGWTAECGKKLPDKKCRKKLYFPSSIILEKTGLDSEYHVRSSSCWRPSFIVMQLKLLATICMIKTRKTYRTLKILPRHVKSGRTCEFRSRFRVNSSIFFRCWWIQEIFKSIELLNNKSHGLSPPRGLASLFFDQVVPYYSQRYLAKRNAIYILHR